MKLSDKMEAFCREYVQDLNATQAAIRAGYSARSSQMQGSRLMSNDIVKQRIQQLMDQRSMRTNITADTVLERINRIADRAEDKGDYTSALKANELLGKHLKLFTDKVEHSGKIGLEDIIAGINDTGSKKA